MTILSASEVAELVAIDESTMTDTATIRRFTSVSDGMGGATDTWATVTTVKCRIQAYTRITSLEQVTSDQMAVTADFVVFLPVGTDVRNTDKLVIGTRTFEVRHGVPHTWQTSLRVPVVEIT